MFLSWENSAVLLAAVIPMIIVIAVVRMMMTMTMMTFIHVINLNFSLYLKKPLSLWSVCKADQIITKLLDSMMGPPNNHSERVLDWRIQTPWCCCRLSEAEEHPHLLLLFAASFSDLNTKVQRPFN